MALPAAASAKRFDKADNPLRIAYQQALIYAKIRPWAMDGMVMFTDPELQEEFDREGFVVVRMLDANRAAAVLDEISAATGADGFLPNEKLTSNYISTLDDRQDRRLLTTQMLGDAMKSSIANRFEGYRTLEHGLVLKPAGATGTPLHQHAPVTEDPFETTILVWCTLADCDAETGSLFIVPRSHNLYRFLRTYNSADYFSDYREALAERYGHGPTLKAGEAIIFHSSLLHGAFANHGKTPRAASVSLIVPAEARHVVYRRDAEECVVLDAETDGFRIDALEKAGVEKFSGTVVGRFPKWSNSATFEQTEALLRAGGPRARVDYDPLDTVAHLAAKAPVDRASYPIAEPTRWRQLARRVPGAVPLVRLARRARSALNDVRAA